MFDQRRSLIRKPFKKNDRFKNHEHETEYGFLYHTFNIWFNSFRFRKRSAAITTVDDWFIEQPPLEFTLEPTITWIGHSTFLIQINGVNILTDPIFGHATWLFRRNMPPGIQLAQLPTIDLLLVSHNHWDHMHGPSLKKLRHHVQQRSGATLVPQGDQHWFMKQEFRNVRGNFWGDRYTLSPRPYLHVPVPFYDNVKVNCIFLPAHHWSRHKLFDQNRSLWGSWMIECNGMTIYFAGDTAYSDHFAEIAKVFPSIDVALLPIGPGEPNEWMKHTHMNAEEAGQAFLDLNARHMVPMHWGTFNFGYEHFDEPIHRLTAWWQKQQLRDKHLHVMKVGQRTIFEKPSALQPALQPSQVMHL